MIDKISHDRIALLHPKIRQEVADLVDFVNTNVLTGKAKMRVTSTLRGEAEQNGLYAQGRTKPGQIVTNAKWLYSNHNFALAFDYALIVDTNGDGIYDQTSWSTTTDYDGDKQADWREVAELFKKHGYSWGGDWKSFKDYPHLEKLYGYSVAQLRAKYLKKDFIPGTNFLRI